MLADDPPMRDGRVPVSLAEPQPRSVRVEQVAANPLNTRDIDLQPDKIAATAESIRIHGQLQPCTVVTREAFLATFPERSDAIGTAKYVQVTGARRRAAILQLGGSTIDIHVRDSLADTRAGFVSATAAENLDRENYDPIEEARAVQLLVDECGTGKQAAAQLSRTAGWVSQRLNLLKLEPELQEALRAAAIPLREARDLHKHSREEQLAALQAWRKLAQSRQQADDARQQRYEDGVDGGGEGDTGAPRRSVRRSPVAAALQKLGGTPVKIAQTLRAELSLEEYRALIEELLREEDPLSGT